MDPITRASRTFLGESARFWRSGRGRVLRMQASQAHRTHLVKTLRLAESAPENRWPLFLYDAPFVDAPSYFSGLADSIRQDYECLRQGAAEEGVTLAPFALAEATPIATLGPVELAAVHIERAATLLDDRLEGVFVALFPPRIPASPRWSESLAMLARIPWSDRVRLAVFDTPGGPAAALLGNRTVRFVLDDQELGAYLKQLGPRPSARPTRPAPPAIAEACLHRDRKEGTTNSVLGRATAVRKLRALLIDATQRAAAGDYSNAAPLYHKAIACCSQSGLILEESMVWIAFGGMCLSAGTTDVGVKSFLRAAAIAQAEKVWSLACQAWLGAAGAHRMRNNHTAAAQAYETAAVMASHAETPALQIEALHLAGTCHLAAGVEHKAATVWMAALQIGEALDAELQAASTLGEVTTALNELLERRGASLRAASLRGDAAGSQAAAHRPPANSANIHEPGF